MPVLGGNPGAAVQYGGTNQGLTGVAGSGKMVLKPDAYYDKLLLQMLRQMEFKYSKYAVEKSLPRNYGDTINWRRFNKLAKTAITALTEGVTPLGLSVSGSSVTATIAQYGDVLYFTDLVDLQQLDKVRQEYTIELGHLAQEVLDIIVRDVLVAEGSAMFAGGVSGLSALTATSFPSINDFRKIVLGMKKSFIKGNRKAGGRYVALVDPSVMAKLFDDSKVRDFMDFGKSNAMFGSGMIVDLFGIHFEEVLNAPYSESAGSATIAYDSIVIGDEAYAITKLEGSGVRVISKGLGSAGVEDPLDQRQSIGYKINGFSAKVLNPEAVVNYWSAPEFEPLNAQQRPTAWGNKNAAPANEIGLVTVTFAPTTAGGATASGSTQVVDSQTLAQAIAGVAAFGHPGSGTSFKYYTLADRTASSEVNETDLIKDITSSKELSIFVESA